MTALFISDLHLSPNNPELTQLATEFLAAQTNDVEQIYLLGDLFNTWLGDDIIPAEFLLFIEQLKSLASSGKQLYLMVGNRDFMLGQQFAKQAGARLLADPALIQLGDETVLLSHGDALCTDDVAYQRYRRWVNNRLLQRCFLALPQRFRQKISDKIKAKSRQQKQHKTAMIMDVNHQAVMEMMQRYQVRLLVHGHTHRPQIHAEGDKHRIVLGDWHDKASYLKFDGREFYLHDHRVAEAESRLRLS